MGVKKPYPIGQSPAAQLRQISEQAHFLCQKQYNCLRHSLLPMLRKQDILLVHFNELDAKQKKTDRAVFRTHDFPGSHSACRRSESPFSAACKPLVESGGAAKKGKETHFAVVQVPSILPRFIAVPNEKNNLSSFWRRLSSPTFRNSSKRMRSRPYPCSALRAMPI